MILKLPCLICLDKLGEEETVKDLYDLRIRDDNIYEIYCGQGHVSYAVDRNPKYDTLFFHAKNAFLDGYYREAVASFASSLERFYEHTIKVLCYARSIDTRKIDETWKHVGKRSERQIGAYAFMHLVAFNEPPHLLKNSEAKFRNDVIHNGKFPSEKKVIEFGESVLSCISATAEKLRQKYKDSIEIINRQSYEESKARIFERAGTDAYIKALYRKSSINTVWGSNEEDLSLGDLLDGLAKRREARSYVKMNLENAT